MIPPNVPWWAKLAALSYALFCLEVGLFLLILPWTEWWDRNWLGGWPVLRAVWESAYWRGAVSGIGVINLLVAIREAFALRRFASRGE